MSFVFGINKLKKVYQDRSQPKSWYVQDASGEWMDRAKVYHITNQPFIVESPYTSEGVQYGEYDEDVVEFTGQSSQTVNFNLSFSNRPIVTLGVSPDSLNDEYSNVNVFVTDLSTTGMTVRTSAGFNGKILYRAINCPTYPGYVRRSVVSSSLVYFASAGYMNVGTDTELLLQYENLGSIPNAIFWGTVDVSGSGTADVAVVSSGSITPSSSTISMSAPLANELHYLAVVAQ